MLTAWNRNPLLLIEYKHNSVVPFQESGGQGVVYIFRLIFVETLHVRLETILSYFTSTTEKCRGGSACAFAICDTRTGGNARALTRFEFFGANGYPMSSSPRVIPFLFSAV